MLPLPKVSENVWKLPRGRGGGLGGLKTNHKINNYTSFSIKISIQGYSSTKGYKKINLEKWFHGFSYVRMRLGRF